MKNFQLQLKDYSKIQKGESKMSRKVRELRKRNNQLELNLNQENQNTLTDIVVYLRTSNISEYQQEVVRKDIMDMMIDGEHRGMDMHDVIGEDYKEFCDNILVELPKQKPFEKVLAMISPICLYGWIVIVLWFLTSLLEVFFGNGTFPMLPLRVGDFISYAVLIFVSIFIVDYIGRNSFEVESKKFFSKSNQKFIFYIIIWLVLFVLSRLLLNDIIYHISFYVGVILLVILYFGYKLFDELFN